MPDVFGQPTPQEVLEQIRRGSAESRLAFSETAAGQSKGGQLGTSLGLIFGGTINKALDTRRDRKTEAARLMKEKGLTQEEAKSLAKENIGFGFSKVREAQKMQKITTQAQEVMARISPVAGPMRAEAVGKLMVAETMRKLGRTTDATKFSQEAAVLLQIDDARLLEVRKLKSDVRTSEKKEALIGATSFRQNQLQRELLLGQIGKPDLSASESERLLVQIGELDSKIEKDSTVVGRTTFDVGSDPTAMRQLFGDFTTDLLLLEGLDLAKLALNDITAYEASFLGRADARFRGFLEDKLVIEPNESSKEFMNRVIASRGLPTLVAAKIRHSLTGAQMSEFEIKFLDPFLPGPGDSRQTMLGKIAAVEAYTQQTAEMRMNLIQSKTLGQFMKGHKTAFGKNLTESRETDGFKSELERAQDTSALVQSLIDAAEAREAGQ